MTDLEASPQSSAVQGCAPTENLITHLDTAADFRSWFEAHFDYVWHTLRRLGVRTADLEDLSHDVFLQVYRNLARYDTKRPVKPWLFGFAYKLASDYRRRASRRRELLGERVEAIDSSPGALELLFRREEHELVHEVLETLELKRRAVFILHELDDCPMPEVAENLEIPLNTAYSRLRLARKQFRTTCERRLRRKRGGT